MSAQGFDGFQDLDTLGSDFAVQQLLIRSVLVGVNTAHVVRVVAVHTAGVNPVGFVDVQPQINQVDGAGNATPLPILHNVPYFRTQGGGCAVIVEPQVNDLGLAVFAQRDISSLVATRSTVPGAKPVNPGSFRRFDLADGLYFGGFLNGPVLDYVWVGPQNIKIVSTGRIDITSGGLGDVNVSSPNTVNVSAGEVKVSGVQGVSITSTSSINITAPSVTVN